ncbi:uncharacterized protein EV420DRAFT_1484906 [Desarmillaria tabescens]|uniref:Uncharacterized protein n=1 Tax=Armillaria tabescens TaxID=1929756 RepID=A0AA39MRL4_ARMTA|nr:uncharacterized protein EV420DRAFT_1484906 [Desarmillaria tabescens]KAK0443688.1 hypothetical protein EV420DRAFT_1484906 [Desarmillaria tabescens]
MNQEDYKTYYSVTTLESTLLLYAYELERTYQRALTLPNSAQACHSPQSQKTTTSSHSKTWKGKMAAGAKKIGLPFGKKTSDETASLQTTESSYTYEKPEGSTLMSLEEESSPTEAMKYASQVQHQEPSKESGYGQMLGTMWEVAVAAQIVQTMEVPGQWMSTPSGHGESPSWPEVAQQRKASQGIRRGIPQSQESKALDPRPAPPAGYPGTQQMGLDESMGSTLHDVIHHQSLAQVDMFQTLQSNLTPGNEDSDLRAWADTFGEPTTARISPVKSTSSIGRTLDTITEGENPIPLIPTRPSGTQTPYYSANEDPWGEQTDTNELLEQHPHADSPPWEQRVLFADTNEEDTVLWWFTGAQSLAGTTNASNPVETELDQASLTDWPHCRCRICRQLWDLARARYNEVGPHPELEPFLNPEPTFYVQPPFISQRELQWWVYEREDFDQIFEEYRRYFTYVWNWNQIWIDGNPYLL